MAEALRPQLAQAARARALDQLDLERENMARAIDWAARRGQWTLGARFVHALLPHWTARSWLDPALELAEAVLAAAEPEADRACASVLMTDTANIAARMGRLERARSLALAALRLAQREASLALEIDALVMRTFCELLDSDPAATVPELELLLERTVQAGLVVQQSRVLSVLGQARTEMGELDAARAALERARQLYQATGNPTGAALETINLAYLAVLSGDTAEARRRLGELARRQPPFEHHIYACFALFTVGCLAGLEGQWARCLRAHLAAQRHFEAGGVADSRLRRHSRERDVERARQALDAATQAAAAREAASSSVGADLAWAFEGLAD